MELLPPVSDVCRLGLSNPADTRLRLRWLFSILVALACAPTLANTATQNQLLAQAVHKPPVENTSSTSRHAQTPVAVPTASEKTLRYYHSGNLLWVFNRVWALLIPALFLFTGFSKRIRDLAQRMGSRWFIVIAAYVVIYLTINYLLNLPINYYQDFVRQHEYGISNQSFEQWLGDSLKSLMVVVVGGILLIWIPYLLIKKSPRRWWLYCGIATVPAIMLFVLIVPVWIAPMFNDYRPMQDEGMETALLKLADRAGIEGSRIFEVNKSEDTEAVNAYVGGFLNTKRIVLWDTLLNKLERDQVLAVMAHEMGHYVLDHTWKLILLFSGLILLALYAIYHAMPVLIRRFQTRFGFDDPADIASLPLLSLLLSAALLVLAPVAMAYTRHMEQEADRFGLEITQDNRAMASALVLLQHENLVHPDPGPLYKLWRAWHPVLADRIPFANEYRPWDSGDPLKYGALFRPLE